MNISQPMRPYVPPYLRSSSPELCIPGPSNYRLRTPSPQPSIQSLPSGTMPYDGFEDIELQELSRAEQKKPARAAWTLRDGFAERKPGPVPGLIILGPPPPMHEVERQPSWLHRACTLSLAIFCTGLCLALPIGVVYAAVRANTRH